MCKTEEICQDVLFFIDVIRDQPSSFHLFKSISLETNIHTPAGRMGQDCDLS